MVTVVYTAFSDGQGGFTLAHFSAFSEISLMRESFANSLFVAGMTVGLGTLIAVPLAYLTVRFQFRGAILIQTLGVLPLVMPAFVGAAAMQLLFGRSGSVNLILKDAFGVTLPLMEGLNGVIFVETLHYFPFILLNLSASLANIDSSMEEAAQNLGASGWRLFRKVVFPLAMPGYVAGASLVFIKVFDDLGTPLVLNVTNMLAPQAYLRVTSIGLEDPIGYVICVILVAFSVGAMGGSWWFVKRRDYALVSRGGVQAPKRRLTPWQSVLAYGWIAGMLFLVLSPHLGILLLSLSKVWSFTVLPEQFTLAHYATVFTESKQMIWNTFLYCGLAALIDVAIGVAIAYIVLRTQLPGRQLLDHLVTVALAMPGLVLGIGYLRTFKGVELPFGGGALTASWIIFVLAYAVRRLPYALRSCMAALTQVHPALEEAAENLGAGPLEHHPPRRRAAHDGRHPRRVRDQLHHRGRRDLGDDPPHQPREPGAHVLRDLPLLPVRPGPRARRGAGGHRRGARRLRHLPFAPSRRGQLAAPVPRRPQMNPVGVDIRHVALSFGKTQVLKDITVSVEPGEFFALLGPSGSGQVDAPSPHRGIQPAPERRGAHRRQGRHRHAALEAQRRHGVPELRAVAAHDGGAERRLRAGGAQAPARGHPRRRSKAALDLVGLAEYAKRRPGQLSGGQQQRVAIARTLAIEPQVLLLDEPLSNLDAKLRVQTRQELVKLQRRLGITTIFVTHDQEEALTTCHRVAVMDEGVIQQVGTPMELFDFPVNRFVAQFVGSVNLFAGTFRREGGALRFASPQLGDVALPAGVEPPAGDFNLAFRPHAVHILEGGVAPDGLALQGHDGRRGVPGRVPALRDPRRRGQRHGRHPARAGPRAHRPGNAGGARRAGLGAAVRECVESPGGGPPRDAPPAPRLPMGPGPRLPRDRGPARGRAGLQVDGARRAHPLRRPAARGSEEAGTPDRRAVLRRPRRGRHVDARAQAAARRRHLEAPQQRRHDVLHPWCPHCKRAKAYFAQKGVGYREVDIEASDAGRREFEQYGGSGVPLIIVGEQRMRGFDAGAMDRLLASAKP